MNPLSNSPRYTTSATVADTSSRLVGGLAGARGCAVVNPSPEHIVVSRSYRPGWAIGAAIFTSLLFLAGLLFLLVKRQEALTISLSSEDGRTAIRWRVY